MPTTKQQFRPKHVPARTCIACGTTQAKRGLLRIVRTPEGAVEIDATGKKNGRGAYVHETRACWDAALKKGKLERALKVVPADEHIAALKAHAASLPPDATSEAAAATPT
jgi:predicted RNA-binding protein YlxR (DUF448 family)